MIQTYSSGRSERALSKESEIWFSFALVISLYDKLLSLMWAKCRASTDAGCFAQAPTPDHDSWKVLITLVKIKYHIAKRTEVSWAVSDVHVHHPGVCFREPIAEVGYRIIFRDTPEIKIAI